MTELTWQPYMATGISEIDDAHRSLIEKMVEVEKASAGRFCAAMQTMIALLETEFRAEEVQMEAINHDALLLHREQHARALSALHHTFSRAMSGDIAAGRHAVSLLQQWFVMHLTTYDMAFAEALSDAGVVSNAEPGQARHMSAVFDFPVVHGSGQAVPAPAQFK